MSTHCSQGQVASRARRGAAWRIDERRGARGVMLPCGPKPGGPACQLGRVAAICALWARPVHAQKVFDEMLGWPKLLGIKCKSTGLGWRPLVGYWTTWFGQRDKSIIQIYNHAKTVHAHKVFDKMLRALRLVLEWPKTLDGGLFRCTRGW